MIFNALPLNRGNGFSGYEVEPISFTPVSGSSLQVNWNSILDNGKISMISKSTSSITFTSGEYPTISGIGQVKIADLTNSLVVGTENSDFAINGVPCVIQADDNKYYSIVANFIFKNGEIYIESNLINDTNNNYQSRNIKSLQITPFNTTTNALYC